MNLKKFISGVSALAIAASAFAAMTVTASAEDTPITYQDTNNTAVGTVVFSPNGAGLGTYTATGIKKGTLTIQYTISGTYNSDGSGDSAKCDSRYRAGLTIGGKTIYVNSTTSNSKGGWGNNNEYHINFKPQVNNYIDKNNVTITIVATINEDGKATGLTVAGSYDNASKNDFTATKIELSEPTDINSIELSAPERSTSYSDLSVTLSNFSATLAASSHTPCSVSDIAGGSYYAYEYDATSNEVKVKECSGTNGASKAAEAAEVAVKAGVTDTYMASKVNTFTVTPNDDTISKVTVKHSDSEKTAELAASDIKLSGAGFISFTIVATASAESKGALSTKLSQLSGSNFTVTVTVE